MLKKCIYTNLLIKATILLEFFIVLCSITLSAEKNIEAFNIVIKEGYGAINVVSIPSDAQIFINGIKSRYMTPAVVPNIKPGMNLIEVKLQEYLFARRRVNIVPDSTIPLSFELISISDTTHIIGDLKLGILLLPRPPLNTPYIIDNKQIYSREVSLNTGKHHVIWEGGNRYTSLDTIVEVFPARLSSFQFNPERLYGELTISPYPQNAEIYLNNRLYTTGELHIILATGTYTVKIKHDGYYTHEQGITINPEKHLYLEIDLEEVPDRDGDGFLDSIDICPDEYGLYEGCSKQNKISAIRKYKDVLLLNFKKQPFIFSVNTIGYIYRLPTNKYFREFISYFNDGKIIFNNKNGFTFGNRYSLLWQGFLITCELGQWQSGLKYKKSIFDTLTIETGKNQYIVVCDSLVKGLNSRIVLPSTCLSIGFNLSINKFNLSYTLGFQWENIKIEDLITIENYKKYLEDNDGNNTKKYKGPITNITFRNNLWANRLHIEYNLIKLKRILPSLYVDFALLLSPNARTGWHCFQTGIVYKFIPSAKIKRKSDREKQKKGD